MKLTGGQIVAEYLIGQGVPYVVAIPGHGNLGLMDAFIGREKKIKVLQCKQELALVHLADGYYRATGRPLAVSTSIGPGAINTAIGAATAFLDSTAVMIITGNAHTYLAGKGLLQEIERVHDANFPRMLEPVVKRYWRAEAVEQLPGIMHRAWSQMMTGRRGPVLIDIPMDVQSDSCQCKIPGPEEYGPHGALCADPLAIKAAANLLRGAQRPVILAGGGVNTAHAGSALRVLAELCCAAVITTLNGKGSYPEDHPLYAWHAGAKGTTCGNNLARRADVLLAVGCRFADETASSYRHGISFSIPPTRLIHVDIDPHEIGKNYPVQIGINADLTTVIQDLINELSPDLIKRNYLRMPYFREILKDKEAWLGHVRKLQSVKKTPVTISRALKEIRNFLLPDAFVVTSSGNTQAQVLQEFPFFVPGTCITTGSASTMGFALPAAIGVKLARPNRQVAAIIGDGDFMMTMQEMSTAKQLGTDVLIIVCNNQGWISIKDLQMEVYGEDRAFATDFRDKKGKLYSPDFAACARAFGLYAEKVSRAQEIKPALERAVKSRGPALVEIIVNREYPFSGSPAVGWWDVPIPTYLKERRKKYERARKQERL